MAKIVMPDNQSFELEDDLASKDEMLRDVLRAAYPDAATATFTREGGKDGKPLVVKVVKKAGPKGSVIADLLNVPESINPAIALRQRLEALEQSGALDHLTLITLRPEIEKAITDGRNEVSAVNLALVTLASAPAEPARTIPRGF